MKCATNIAQSRRPRSSFRTLAMMRTVLRVAIVLIAVFLVAATAASSDSDDNSKTNKKKNKNILQGHVYVHSQDASKSHKNGQVEISEPRARAMADAWPIRYYSGTIRYHMYAVQNPHAATKDDDDEEEEENDEDEYYVFEAWCGPASSDGTVLQVFQLTANAPLERVAETMFDYGGSQTRGDEPFCALGSVQIRQFLVEMARQKDARTAGLQGVQVHVHALKRLYQDGIGPKEACRAEIEAQTILAEEAGAWFHPLIRIRTATLSSPQQAQGNNATAKEFFYVIVEEDSSLGYLYDNTFGLLYNFLLGSSKEEDTAATTTTTTTTTKTLWAREWGRRAIYKFLLHSPPPYMQLGIRAYNSGKTDVKRLDRLLTRAWPSSSITTTRTTTTTHEASSSAATSASTTTDETESGTEKVAAEEAEL